jgi:voltage-gated potassium channel
LIAILISSVFQRISQSCDAITPISNNHKSVGYGDICPTKQAPLVGKIFIVVISFLGLGVFCGPLLAVTSSWRHTIPGGLCAVALWTLGVGVLVFSYEGISTTDALYASVITGTTIGYGDLTPSTEVGKILVAFYAVLVVGVTGVLLDVSKERLIQFCIPAPPKVVPEEDADKKEK